MSHKETLAMTAGVGRRTAVATALLSCLLSLPLIGCSESRLAPAVPHTADPRDVRRVQDDVEQIVSALHAGNVDRVLEFTHPLVIDSLGGYASARQALEASLVQIRAAGIKMERIEFPEEPRFLRSTLTEFVIVPTKSVFSTNTGPGESLNYQFGARPVGADQWKYIEGSRMDEHNASVLFPDFPKGYQFPQTYRRLID